MIYPYVSSLFGDEFVIVLYAWFLRIIRAICAPTRYRPVFDLFSMIGPGRTIQIAVSWMLIDSSADLRVCWRASTSTRGGDDRCCDERMGNPQRGKRTSVKNKSFKKRRVSAPGLLQRICSADCSLALSLRAAAGHATARWI